MLIEGDSPLNSGGPLNTGGRDAAPEQIGSAVAAEGRGPIGDEPAATESSPFKWYHKASAIAFTIICFELGVFLLVFPWMDKWETNYFGSFTAHWREVWQNPYFRGAVSGLGLVNIFISFVEIVRLRRFSVQ
jgi:hypothetical protein